MKLHMIRATYLGKGRYVVSWLPLEFFFFSFSLSLLFPFSFSFFTFTSSSFWGGVLVGWRNKTWGNMGWGVVFFFVLRAFANAHFPPSCWVCFPPCSRLPR